MENVKNVTITMADGGVIKLEKLGVDVSDGLFEMTLIKLPKTLYQTGEIAYSLSSGDYNSSLITFERFSSCKVITNSESLNWSIDGERGDKADVIEISNIKQAVNIVTTTK